MVKFNHPWISKDDSIKQATGEIIRYDTKREAKAGYRFIYIQNTFPDIKFKVDGDFSGCNGIQVIGNAKDDLKFTIEADPKGDGIAIFRVTNSGFTFGGPMKCAIM